MAVFVIPQPIARWNQGYAWHLKGSLLSWEKKAGSFYSLTFSTEENALIKEYDTNITKLGLLDASFLYLVFEKGRIQEKQAKAVSVPLTRMKKGILKTIECYPLATFREIEEINNCPWEKGNVIIEAETIQPEGTDSITAIDSAFFGPEDASFFQNQYSSVRKTGLAHIFYKAHLIYKTNLFVSLTNIAQSQQDRNTMHLRRPEDCCNMFQFAKLLFYNQELFEKNVFRERLREVTCQGQENTGDKAFAEKIEAIYKGFEEEKGRINNTVFNFFEKQEIGKVFNPDINFQNTHFKFSNAFLGNSRKTSGVPTAFYLTKKEDGYRVYWPQEKTNLNEKILEEVSAFLKFYLAFCSLLQLTAKEFFSEMLPENI